MIRIKGFHEGLYDLSIEFSFAVGNIGPTKEQMLPGAMFGVSGVGLIKTEQVGPNTVDAALVNPTKPSRKKKKENSDLPLYSNFRGIGVSGHIGTGGYLTTFLDSTYACIRLH